VDIEAMGIEFVKMIIPEIILAVLPLPLKFLKNRNLWFAKLRDWKNRKLIEDIVVGRIRHESDVKFWTNTKYYWFQLIFIHIIFSILLLFCWLGAFVVRLQMQNVIQSTISRSDWIIIWTILLGNIVLSAVVASQKKFKWYIGAVIITVYVFLQMVYFTMDLNSFLIVVSIAVFMVTVALQSFLENNIFMECYKNGYIKISKFIRCIGIMFIIVICLEKQEWLTYCIYLWMFMTTMEYMIMILGDQRDLVEVTICFKDHSAKTGEAIATCHDGRLLYISEEGVHKFEDIQNVRYIHYEFINSGKKIFLWNKVYCVLKDGQVRDYDWYSCRRGDWMMFGKAEDNKRMIDIFPISRIKEFVNTDMCIAGQKEPGKLSDPLCKEDI
jgi:hypothetical protein